MKTNADDATEQQENVKPEVIHCVAARRICDLKPKLMYNCLLVGVLVLYGLVGGFVFKTFETASVGFDVKPLEAEKGFLSTEDLLSELLRDQNTNKEPLDEKWRRSAVAKIDEFITRKTITEQVGDPVQWSFADSWLFACTIFTTIGEKFKIYFIYMELSL
jgi:hypothetical protein